MQKINKQASNYYSKPNNNINFYPTSVTSKSDQNRKSIKPNLASNGDQKLKYLHKPKQVNFRGSVEVKTYTIEFPNDNLKRNPYKNKKSINAQTKNIGNEPYKYDERISKNVSKESSSNGAINYYGHGLKHNNYLSDHKSNYNPSSLMTEKRLNAKAAQMNIDSKVNNVEKENSLMRELNLNQAYKGDVLRNVLSGFRRYNVDEDLEKQSKELAQYKMVAQNQQQELKIKIQTAENLFTQMQGMMDQAKVLFSEINKLLTPSTYQ